MLRNVLGDYLNSLKEREFDLPFITLLPAMGFYDIHFTHGQVEFGKDFIAKRRDDEREIQYSFQSKAGDINQSTWRNDIMGQMLELVHSGLSHPNFNKNLPHQAVLLTTGRLIGNAGLGFQDFNENLQNKYNERPVIFWDRENLIDYLESYGLGAIHRVTPTSFVDYGNFYVLYGKTLQGIISDRELEQHSRQWLEGKLADSKKLLAAAIEGEILAQKCVEKGFLYEAIHAYLNLYRVILFQLYDVAEPNETQRLLEIIAQTRRKLYTSCYRYFSEFKKSWIDSGKELVKSADGPGSMVTYLVNCARILEISGCLYFMEENITKKNQIISFVQDFIALEPGCTHIPGDRYAISLVFPVLASGHNIFSGKIYAKPRKILCCLPE